MVEVSTTVTTSVSTGSVMTTTITSRPSVMAVAIEPPSTAWDGDSAAVASCVTAVGRIAPSCGDVLTSAFSGDLASVENALASLPSLCLANQCAAAMEHALGNCSGTSAEQAIRRQMEALEMLCSPCLKTTIGMKRDCTHLIATPARLCTEPCRMMVHEWNTENCNQLVPIVPFESLASMGSGRLLSENLDELELLQFMVEELVAALSHLGVNSTIDGEFAAGKLVEYFASVGAEVAITNVE